MLIHRCRIYLQVEVLSDIANSAGDTISESWFEPHSAKTSYSLKKWPKQQDPGKEAWRIWKHHLMVTFMNQSGKLRTVLGKWTRQNESRVHLSYCSEDASLLYTRDQNGSWQAHTQKCSGRRCLFFLKTSYPLASLPTRIIPVDIRLQTDELILIEGWSTISPKANAQETCGNLKEYIRLTASARSEKIMLLIDEPEIHDILRNPTRIEVASDGGFDPSTGISSYG
jgi:hypothetical protein